MLDYPKPKNWPSSWSSAVPAPAAAAAAAAATQKG